jgi:hypothetical protein
LAATLCDGSRRPCRFKISSDKTAHARHTVARREGEQAWVLAHPGPAPYGRDPGPPPPLRGLPDEARLANHRRPQSDDDGAAAKRAALRKQLDQLGRAQTNLIKQLEAYEPTGDDDLDTEWTAALQRRFAQITAQRRSVTTRLAELDKQDHDQAGGNAALLDLLPQAAIDPTLLPKAEQRELYDAFHPQVRYDRTKHQVTLRVTIHAEAVGTLTNKIRSLGSHESVTSIHDDAPVTPARSHVVSAPGRSQNRPAPPSMPKPRSVDRAVRRGR